MINNAQKIKLLLGLRHMHCFVHVNRPIGGYDFDYYHCDECQMNKLEKNDPKEKWLTDDQLEQFIESIQNKPATGSGR